MQDEQAVPKIESVDLGKETAVWAPWLGRLLIIFGEIEIFIHLAHTEVLQKEDSKAWKNKAIAKKIDSLVRDISDDSEHHGHLKESLSEVKNFIDDRNVIAHGAFAINTDPAVISKQSQMVFFSRRGKKIVKLENLIFAVHRCRHLSDVINESISLIKSHMKRSEK